MNNGLRILLFVPTLVGGSLTCVFSIDLPVRGRPPAFLRPPSLNRLKLDGGLWVHLKRTWEDGSQWAPPGYFGPLKVKVSTSVLFHFHQSFSLTSC